MIDIFELPRKLAADPELRKEVEAEIQSRMAPGTTFYIDDQGLGHAFGPLIRSRIIDGKADIETDQGPSGEPQGSNVFPVLPAEG